MEYQKAKLFALKRLVYRNQPSSELAHALQKKGVPDKIIEKVIEELQQQGYCDDQTWLESYIAHETATKHRGPHAILAKLKQKQVSQEMLAAAKQKLQNREKQKESIIHLIKTRYAKTQLQDFQQKQKMIASLARRGFEVEEILEVIREISNI